MTHFQLNRSLAQVSLKAPQKNDVSCDYLFYVLVILHPHAFSTLENGPWAQVPK